MHRLHLLAVAARLPDWAEAACTEYLGRMPRGFSVRRVTVKPEPRTQGRTVEQMTAAEAKRVLAAAPADARRVAMDERGRDLTTAQFAALLREWLDSGTPTVLVIGGPDGLDRRTLSPSSAIRLSSMTLPHSLAQVVICEQLYRAAALLTGHPYHRE